MRNLFLVLVLANLAFAAWHSWYAEDTGSLVRGDREFGEIMLAAEFAEANPELGVAEVRVELDEGLGPEAFRVVTQATAGEDAAAAPAGDVDTSLDETAVNDPFGPTEAGADAVLGDTDPDAGLTAAADAAPDDGSAAADVIDGAPEAVAEAQTGGAGATAAEQMAPTDQAEPVAATVGVCTSVGPFSELSQVTGAAANLREDGLVPRQRAGEGEIWAGYWVYLEQIESVAAARDMLAALRDGGLTDAYIIPDSDSGTLISLGVFSEIVRASRMLEAARNLGFEATIADRVRTATVYWIDVDVAAGATLDFERLQPPGRIVRLEQRPCEEVVL